MYGYGNNSEFSYGDHEPHLVDINNVYSLYKDRSYEADQMGSRHFDEYHDGMAAYENATGQNYNYLTKKSTSEAEPPKYNIDTIVKNPNWIQTPKSEHFTIEMDKGWMCFLIFVLLIIIIIVQNNEIRHYKEQMKMSAQSIF